MDPHNYRKRTLHRLARDLKLPKLAFQGDPANDCNADEKKGTVKDIQGLLRHSRAATTTDVYMQEIPASVQATVEAISGELRQKPKRGKSDRMIVNSSPNAPKSERAMSVIC